MNDENCPACAERRGAGLFHLVRKGRVVRESDSFILVPAIGSMIRYYLILKPKAHCVSFSKMSKSQLLETAHLLEAFLSDYGSTFDVVIAEHGENFKSLEHAHLHVLLIEDDAIRPELMERLKRYALQSIASPRVHDAILALAQFSELDEYIVVYDNTAHNLISVDTTAIQNQDRRQYLRKELSRLCGVPWNWIAFPGTDLVEQAYKVFGAK